MLKFISILFLSLFSYVVIAQQGILFSNKTTGKEIMIKEGDLIKISYNGYIKQREVKSGMVTSIQDSLIEISSPNTSGIGGMDTRFVYIKDITGFRKFHKSKAYLMFLSKLMVAAGSIYTYYIIDQKTVMSFGEKLGVSMGTGVISTIVIRMLFPDRIKNTIGEGWTIEVLK